MAPNYSQFTFHRGGGLKCARHLCEIIARTEGDNLISNFSSFFFVSQKPNSRCVFVSKVNGEK